MFDASFDITPYTRSPVFDVPGGIAFGQQLIAAAPPDATGPVLEALRAVREKHTTLRDDWHARDAAESPIPAKVTHEPLVAAWTALNGRLEACSGLPESVYAIVTEANGLLAALFSDGLSFTQLEPGPLYAQSDKRVQRIQDDKLGPIIERVAGREFLDFVVSAHARFGDALGMNGPVSVAPQQPDLNAARRDLGNAIADYGLQLVAAGKAAKTEEEFQAILVALRPMDEQRANNARNNNSASGEPVSGTPTGTAPPAPTAPTGTTGTATATPLVAAHVEKAA